MAGPGGRGGGWFRSGFLLLGAGGLPSVALSPEPLMLPGEEEEEDGRAGRRVLSVRPSWSSVALVLGASLSPPSSVELLGGAGPRRRRLPGDVRAALPSESHVLLLREAALEAWPIQEGEEGARLCLEGEPLWRKEAPPPGQGPDDEAAGRLPLFPGGFVAPRPPFFWPLRGAFLRAESLALGLEHALLLVAAGPGAGKGKGKGGGLFAWGAGRYGQLGHGGLESRSEPEPVEALQGIPVEGVAAGGWHSAAVTDAGDLYLWGWNESGQLALPSKALAAAEDKDGAGDAEKGPPDPLDTAFVSIQAFPALLDLPDGAEVLKVSCGSRHTAALTRTGDLYTWGWGQYGQLGHGDTASSDRPRKVGCFADWDLCVVDVTCGPWATYAQTVRRTADQSPAGPEG